MSEDSKTHVIAAVLQRQGKYLVCKRAAHKRHGNLWEFPGGKIEANETQLDAARRELSEELGLEVTGAGLLRMSAPDPASGFMIDFVDVTAEGEPRLLEHSQLGWYSLEELNELPLAPSDRQFVEFLRQRYS